MSEYVLPERAEVVVYEDPTPRPDRRTKMVAKCKLGPCVLDTSRISLAETPALIQFSPEVKPGVFTRKLIALMKLVMRRTSGKEESPEEAAPGTAAPDAGGGAEGAG